MFRCFCKLVRQSVSFFSSQSQFLFLLSNFFKYFQAVLNQKQLLIVLDRDQTNLRRLPFGNIATTETSICGVL